MFTYQFNGTYSQSLLKGDYSLFRADLKLINYTIIALDDIYLNDPHLIIPFAQSLIGTAITGIKLTNVKFDYYKLKQFLILLKCCKHQIVRFYFDNNQSIPMQMFFNVLNFSNKSLQLTFLHFYPNLEFNNDNFLLVQFTDLQEKTDVKINFNCWENFPMEKLHEQIFFPGEPLDSKGVVNHINKLNLTNTITPESVSMINPLLSSLPLIELNLQKNNLGDSIIDLKLPKTIKILNLACNNIDTLTLILFLKANFDLKVSLISLTLDSNHLFRNFPCDRFAFSMKYFCDDFLSHLTITELSIRNIGISKNLISFIELLLPLKLRVLNISDNKLKEHFTKLVPILVQFPLHSLYIDDNNLGEEVISLFIELNHWPLQVLSIKKNNIDYELAVNLAKLLIGHEQLRNDNLLVPTPCPPLYDLDLSNNDFALYKNFYFYKNKYYIDTKAFFNIFKKTQLFNVNIYNNGTNEPGLFNQEIKQYQYWRLFSTGLFFYKTKSLPRDTVVLIESTLTECTAIKTAFTKGWDYARDILEKEIPLVQIATTENTQIQLNYLDPLLEDIFDLFSSMRLH